MEGMPETTVPVIEQPSSWSRHMRSNLAVKPAPVHTHEGAHGVAGSPLDQLRRSVMSCLLFEDTFYEDGQSVADRIVALVPQCAPLDVANVAVGAREMMKLRHVPLLIVAAMTSHAKHKALVADTLARIIQRPDELAEFVAIYFKIGSKKLSAQAKKGLARAFAKFDEYQLAKYDREGAWRLRDVLFMCHAKPADVPRDAAKWNRAARASLPPGKAFVRDFTPGELLFGRLVHGEMAVPNTHEVRMSSGEDPAAVFRSLMASRHLGALAFLRNLRKMSESGITPDEILGYASTLNVERILPFQFIAAARAAPQLESILEPMMLKACASLPRLPGPTAILIDHSSSMEQTISERSEISRFDAACAMAIMVREVCHEARVFTFSDCLLEIPNRRGFALVDAARSVMRPLGTLLGRAVAGVYKDFPRCERVIVITDEQSSDRPQAPKGRGYIINVASNQNGIGHGAWVTIDGWSEHLLRFVAAHEGLVNVFEG